MLLHLAQEARTPLPIPYSLSYGFSALRFSILFREIGAEIHRRRLNLTPSLRDYDRFNRGVVPGTMFERALSSVGLLPVRRK